MTYTISQEGFHCPRRIFFSLPGNFLDRENNRQRILFFLFIRFSSRHNVEGPRTDSDQLELGCDRSTSALISHLKTQYHKVVKTDVEPFCESQ